MDIEIQMLPVRLHLELTYQLKVKTSIFTTGVSLAHFDALSLMIDIHSIY